jgi:hypothetical protein
MIATNRARRALVVLGLASLLAAGVPAAQATEQRYAVLSLIGDSINLVWWQPPTGSNLDHNERQSVPTPDGSLDNVALLAVDDALRRANPKANPTLLASRDPKLFALQLKTLDSGASAGELLAAVRVLLQQSQATRLILVSKHRGEARLPMRYDYAGSGKLTGLGFYIDQQMMVRDVNGGAGDRGFIAPYAYLELALIDAQTMNTIRRSVVREATTVPTAASSGAANPWEALTNKEKFRELERLIQAAVARAVPELLASE